MVEISDDWLSEFNRKMSEQEVPYIQRPFRALCEWTRERTSGIVFGSPTANRVFRWFEEHAPVEAHAIGPVFTGTFFFDAYFWPVLVPLAYGTVRLNALDFLNGMPEPVKSELSVNQRSLTEYVLCWADCLDYGYGFDEILTGKKCAGFALELALSADHELRATVCLLTESRQPNAKAMDSARMATEMFLKAYLAVHASLDESSARDRLGHDLKKAATECAVVGRDKGFTLLVEAVGIFPGISARYKANSYSLLDLSRGYFVAQTHYKRAPH